MVRRRLWLSRFVQLFACLGVSLAGCAAERLRPVGRLSDLSADAHRLETAGPIATLIARRGPPVEGEADPRPEAAVDLVRFDSASDDSQAPEIPPAPLPRHPLDLSTPHQSVIDELVPTPGLPGPRRIDEVLPRASGEPERPDNTYELSLSDALVAASGENPQVAFAAQRYREAYARLEAARVLWLPTIHGGVSYNKHEGVLQKSDGLVFNSSRASLQTGLGVRSVGTGSPPVPGLVAEFHLTDAIFQPRIANRAAAARQEALKATTHDLLLDTALAYLDLLKAIQEKAIAQQTLDNAQHLADLTATFAKTGQGSQADADRAKAELVVRKNDVTRAEEGIAVASARLTELLHMDPATVLVPREPTIVPIDLVALEQPVTELLATGLSNRPELAKSRQLVCEAVDRYRREKYAPLLPSAFFGVSYGEFGGAPGSSLDNTRDRFDFDVAASWELRNLGFAERAARDETRSRYEQARAREIQVMDRVAREIMEAHAQVEARHKQIAVAESGIEAATDSYKRNMERIRSGEGLPIEVLQSLQALDQARREYLRTVVGYNEAQFRLHRALGWPIQ